MMNLIFTTFAVSFLAGTQALQCLPSRSCPSTDAQKYMCVGYTDVSGATRLLCDGVHTKVSSCRDYYRGRGGTNIICCDTDNCLKGSQYDAAARILYIANHADAVGKALAAGSAWKPSPPAPKALACYLNGPESNTFIKSSQIGPEGCADANFCASYNLDGKQWYQCINYADRPAADCQLYFERLGASGVRCCSTDYCNQPPEQRSLLPPAIRVASAANQSRPAMWAIVAAAVAGSLL